MIYQSEKIQLKASLGEDEQPSSFPATGFFFSLLETRLTIMQCLVLQPAKGIETVSKFKNKRLQLVLLRPGRRRSNASF